MINDQCSFAKCEMPLSFASSPRSGGDRNALRVVECGSHLPLYVDDQRYPKAPEGWRSPRRFRAVRERSDEGYRCRYRYRNRPRPRRKVCTMCEHDFPRNPSATLDRIGDVPQSARGSVSESKGSVPGFGQCANIDSLALPSSVRLWLIFIEADDQHGGNRRTIESQFRP
jgi:hypothetical protein